MPVIKANTDGITGMESNVRAIRSKISECYQEVNRVKNNLDWQVQARNNINDRLSSVQRRISNQDEKLQSYIRVLDTAAGNFGDKDRQLKKDARDLLYELNACRSTNMNPGNTQKTKSSKSSWFLDVVGDINDLFDKASDKLSDPLLSILKKAGLFGSIIDFAGGIKEIATGGGVGNIIKNSYDAIKTVMDWDETLKNMGKVKRILHPDTVKTVWKKKLLGIGDYFGKSIGKASKAKKFGTRFYNNLQKAKVKELAKASWIDVAISGVVNIFENKKEHGGFTKRAVAETVTETAIDVGVDMALTATAAAAIGAAFGAAPVLAVGATVVVAKMGLDAVAKWATGGEKDFTEAASDLILDGATAIGKGIAKGAEKVGNAISSALKSAKSKWKFSFGF